MTNNIDNNYNPSASTSNNNNLSSVATSIHDPSLPINSNNNNNNSFLVSQRVELWNIQASVLDKNIPSNLVFTDNSNIIQIQKQTLESTIPQDEKDKEFTVLDIAAGCGFLSIYGTTKYINAKFISTDFAPNYIQFKNRLIKDQSLSNIKTMLMDGQNLNSIQSGSIDYVFSILGLVFFPNRMASLKEMHRVLKSNGKVAIVSSSKDSFINTVLNNATKKLLGDDYYQFKSAGESLSNPDDLKNELIEAGFKNIEIKQVEHWLDNKEIVPFSTIIKLNPIYHDHFSSLPFEKRHLYDDIINQEALESPLRTPPGPDGIYKFKSFGYIGIGTK